MKGEEKGKEGERDKVVMSQRWIMLYGTERDKAVGVGPGYAPGQVL